MKSGRQFLIQLIAVTGFFSLVVSSMAYSAQLNCNLTGPVSGAYNRFQLKGLIEITEKGDASAHFSGKVVRAGVDGSTKELPALLLTGRVRLYPAGTLAKTDVHLIQLSNTTSDQTISLKAASGLMGPQSTLIVNQLPYRAECKLN